MMIISSEEVHEEEIMIRREGVEEEMKMESREELY